MKQCEQCEQATIELALIKVEIDAWQEAEKDGLGELSAGPRIRRIAKRFEGFELLAHPSPDDRPPRLELSFPPDRAYTRAGGSLGPLKDATWSPEAREALGLPGEEPKQRSSMRTLFEFRTRSWVKWFVLPLAWVVSLLGAWWVLH